MKNTTFFAILGFLTAFVPLETQANVHILPKHTKKPYLYTDSKTTFQMKEGSISDLIELLIAYKPEDQESYDSWIAFGKTFDLYRYPSDKPLAKNTRIFVYDKEHETEEGKKRPENLERVYTGENCVAVVLNVLEKSKDHSIDNVVKALNHYTKTGVLLFK